MDFSTLKWVKSELDDTLKQARQALEAFVENPEDDSQLRFCSAHLHQVSGTLQMVELYGASMLAEEMEKLLLALLDGSVAQKDDAYELLMRGILQLPDYLDRLIAGYQDIPLVLLPLLNDLRAVQGGTLVSENALFSPDIERPLPDAVMAMNHDEDVQALARQLRHQYQVALLAWFRGKNEAESFAGMAAVLEQLQAACTTPEGCRVWWIAQGVIRAIESGLLEPSMATKLLLGQVDRQIKRVIDNGEVALRDTPPVELLKNLLFYVARARGGEGIVSDIKSTYSLDALLPDEDQMEQARQSLTGHNTELMETVTAAIKEDLARVKDALDIYLRSSERDLAALTPVAETLDRVGDTLGMLGMGSLRKQLVDQAGIAHAMVEGNRPVDDDVLMQVASAVLYVESSLDGVLHGDVRQADFADENQSAAAMVPESEFNQVRGVVAEEAIRDIARSKDAILQHIDSPEDYGLLQDVPAIFNQIKGSLLLLNEGRAAGILESVADFINQEMLGKQRPLAETELNQLADAISSIEYFLENLQERKVFSGSILDVAQQSMESLSGRPVQVEPAAESGLSAVTGGAAEADSFDEAAAPEVSETEAEAEAEEIVLEVSSEEDGTEAVAGEAGSVEIKLDGDDESMELVELEATESPEETEVYPGFEDDAESGEVIELQVPEDGDVEAIELGDIESTTEETIEVSEGSGETGGEAAATQDQVAAPEAPADLPYPVLESTDIDDEILEIFIEEATEEVAGIRENLPKWLDNAEDKDAMTEMRRSYHTLKGSGRLVGAMLIGEFAWAFENMLNRVIDGTAERDDTMCGLLQLAADTLPEMVEQIQGRGGVSRDVGAMMQAAEALSRGESVDLTSLTSGAGDAASAETEVEVEPEAEFETAAPDAADEVMEVIEVSMDEVTEQTPEETDDLIEHESSADEVPEKAGPTESNLDPVLFDIFDNEARDHLATIRDFLANADSTRDSSVTDDLIRAVHTLHGSAHMAGANRVADIAAEMERYTKALSQAGMQMPEEGMTCFRDSVTMVETLIPLLLQAEQELPDCNHIIECLQRLPREGDELLAQGVEEATPGSSNPWTPDDDEPFEAETPEAVAEAKESVEVGIEVSEAVTEEDVATEAGTDEAIEITEIEVPEAQVAEAPVADASAAEDEEADQELIDIFLEEGDEILENAEQVLQQWIKQPDDVELMSTMQRDLHTLKGGARMANLTAIGDLTHHLESLMISANDGQVPLSPDLFDLMQLSQDRLVQMLEAVKAGRHVPPADDLIPRIDAIRKGEAVAAAVPDPQQAGVAATDNDIEVVPIPPVQTIGSQTQAQPERQERTQQEQVRVRADLLDDMVNYAGEISIYRARLEQQVGTFRFNLTELGQTVTRMREQLRKMEIETEAQVLSRYEREYAEAEEQDEDFDPLEMDRYSTLQTLSRSMMESIGDMVSLQNLLDNITRESETLLLQQSRVNTDLSEGLMRTRMVPFSGLAPRMRRIVRQVCQEVGKRAELVLEGAEGEMDRTVIDRIIAPLEHMLRNAIAHGIESPEVRREHSKPEQGTIKVALRREGSEVVIQIDDDGAGMDIEAIRTKAYERGFITDDTDFTDNEIMQFVLETGFSTAQEVTQIAGRGVGMDVVNSEVKQLGGSLHINSVSGEGTTFTIRLPFTLAMSQALLVQVREETYAIPLTGIEGIVRIPQEQLGDYYADPEKKFAYAGYEYDVRYLGNMLGTGEPVMGSAMPKRLPVLLVRTGDHHMALQVDTLLGSRETVVKSVGPQISTVRGISGATILGDGRVVLILDLGGLLRAGEITTHIEPTAPQPADMEENRVLTVMVVDDSITVRKVTSRLLERNEMEVFTAKDGVDAVAKLQEHIPDVMLLDIEMPRMDGFELATHIRNEARLKHIPIIMITSRTGEKHRQRAMDIGVDFYLGKPYQEQQLLDTIQKVIKDRETHAG